MDLPDVTPGESEQRQSRRQRRRTRRRDFGYVISEGTATEPAFSVRWYEGAARKRKRGFRTRADATAFLARMRVAFEDGGDTASIVPADNVTVGAAITAYEEYRRDKGNKPHALGCTTYRLKTFFTELDIPLSELTPAACAGYYEGLRRRKTRLDETFSVDSHRNTLSEAKSLLKWCVGRNWLRRNPLEGLEGKGKRRRGKEQLRIDEARSWTAKAIELAEAGEDGAVAALMALLLGMRATEIVSRVVRDLDDDGQLVWIDETKTEAGRRTLRVPDVLRPFLKSCAQGKAPGQLLFGEHWRDWPRKWVQRICKAAAVPAVSAHSMRGLHSTLAMEAGVTGHVVASSLGHESVTTTVANYAKPEAVASAKQERTMRVLNGGRSGAAATG